MEIDRYRREINPCYGCGCWDEDMDCIMPSQYRCYACPLEAEKDSDYGD